MKDKGTLRKIRALLGEGRSTGEVIEMGFAPGSVYRARRQRFGRIRADGLETSVAAIEDLGEQLEQLSERVEETFESVEQQTKSADAFRATIHWMQVQYEQNIRRAESERDSALARAEALQATVNRLAPLEVWAGHPCCYCGEAVSEHVSREVARQLTKTLAHADCIKEHDAKRWLTFDSEKVVAGS